MKQKRHKKELKRNLRSENSMLNKFTEWDQKLNGDEKKKSELNDRNSPWINKDT